MKLILISFVTIFICSIAFPQSKKKAEDVARFNERAHHFGKLKRGVPVTYDFTVDNVGDSDLVIESVTSSCGCTVASSPTSPIKKGKSDKIKVLFGAGAVGDFNKRISVKIKGVDFPATLNITGEVLDEDAFAAFQ